MIPRPVNISLSDWADAVTYSESVPRLDDDNWQQWGTILRQYLDIPDPHDFADWVSWAERVCEEVQ